MPKQPTTTTTTTTTNTLIDANRNNTNISKTTYATRRFGTHTIVMTGRQNLNPGHNLPRSLKKNVNKETELESNKTRVRNHKYNNVCNKTNNDNNIDTINNADDNNNADNDNDKEDNATLATWCFLSNDKSLDWVFRRCVCCCMCFVPKAIRVWLIRFIRFSIFVLLLLAGLSACINSNSKHYHLNALRNINNESAGRTGFTENMKTFPLMLYTIIFLAVWTYLISIILYTHIAHKYVNLLVYRAGKKIWEFCFIDQRPYYFCEGIWLKLRTQ
jgi:hypothetical protein